MAIWPMQRRVRDLFSGQLGTAVEHLGRDQYRVEWDDPTPHQDKARPKIPSKFFEWADSDHSDGSPGGEP